MNYSQESYASIIGEIKPLLEEHYQEIATYKDIPLEPDWDMYQKLEEMSILNIFSARLEDNTLVGYAIYLVRPHIHYKSCVIAQQDILFITKEHRGQGMIFIMWCDEQLRKMGVNMTIQHMKASHNFGKMLERIGYDLMDLIYTRRL